MKLMLENKNETSMGRFRYSLAASVCLYKAKRPCSRCRSSLPQLN